MTQDPVLGRRVWSDRQLRQRLAEDEARSGSGGGGGGMLPVPDLSVGYPATGFFGADITSPKTKPDATPDWSPAFDRAWTLDSGSPSPVAVDNAHMAWDPNGVGEGADAAHIAIKQDGWYSIYYGFGFTNPLAELDNFGVDTVAGVVTGSTDFDIPVGSGSSGFGYSGIVQSCLFDEPTTPGPMSLTLKFHNSLSVPAELSYGWLVFFPMFTLA